MTTPHAGSAPTSFLEPSKPAKGSPVHNCRHERECETDFRTNLGSCVPLGIQLRWRLSCSSAGSSQLTWSSFALLTEKEKRKKRKRIVFFLQFTVDRGQKSERTQFSQWICIKVKNVQRDKSNYNKNKHYDNENKKSWTEKAYVIGQGCSLRRLRSTGWLRSIGWSRR